MNPKPSEDSVLEAISNEIRRTRTLSGDQKLTLSKIFEKRFSQAMAVVEGKNVTSYRFSPSGRTAWIVKGRKGEYQVMPASMFCTCDDYYFRVMDNKKQLCYHLVAQRIAEALDQYDVQNLADSRYAGLSEKWASRNPSARS